LGEVIDGAIALIHNPEISDLDLMQYIQGPDFPTGGQIIGRSGIREAYLTGRGSITMRGVAEIETLQQRGRADKEAIIITQLPYQTNKAALIEKIADLVNDKRIDGISDIRDESDRTGMRIVIELKRDAYPRVVLNNLYKQTAVQSNFGANMLALVNNDPQLLTIRRFLEVFLEFRVEAITRRTRYQLRKAEERDHLLQGLLIALENIDSIIGLIRGAADTATAKNELVEGFGLSQTQSDAILQMQLRRLTALEAEKIQAEHEDLQIQIADLNDILARKERIEEIIESELTTIRNVHATPRRTEIVQGEGELLDKDLIANEQSVILLTEQGYIKRMPVSTFEAQSRATRGKAAAKMKEDDGIEHFMTCCDHDTVMFFSDRGVVYSFPAYQIPATSRTARGIPIIQMLPVSQSEKITSMIGVSEFTEDEYLIMLTRKGNIKKTALSAFANIRSNGLIAISLQDEDELRWVRLATNEDSVIIGTRKGMAIHFKTNSQQLRPLGRSTKGVKSMKLKTDDELISMDIIPSQIVATIDTSVEDEDEDDSGEELVDEAVDQGPWLLAITKNGYGKRVPIAKFRLQNRAGMGVRAIKFKSKDDRLVAIDIVNLEDELMIVTNRGIMIRQAVKAISLQSRNATGVRVQRLDKDDAIAAVAPVPPLEEEGEETEE
jgi:DNA gyrase subunit A